jgi:hypothetical protein
MRQACRWSAGIGSHLEGTEGDGEKDDGLCMCALASFSAGAAARCWLHTNYGPPFIVRPLIIRFSPYFGPEWMGQTAMGQHHLDNSVRPLFNSVTSATSSPIQRGGFSRNFLSVIELDTPESSILANCLRARRCE